MNDFLMPAYIVLVLTLSVINLMGLALFLTHFQSLYQWDTSHDKYMKTKQGLKLLTLSSNAAFIVAVIGSVYLIGALNNSVLIQVKQVSFVFLYGMFIKIALRKTSELVQKRQVTVHHHYVALDLYHERQKKGL